MERILLLVFGGIAVALLVAIQVIDMAARIEWIDQHWPWLLGWAAHKAWHRLLLLVAIVLLAADLWEITKEQSRMPTTVVSADLQAKNATIKQLQTDLEYEKTRRATPVQSHPSNCPQVPSQSQPSCGALESQVSDLRSQLQAKEHMITGSDSALSNILFIVRTFGEFRKEIGTSPCFVRVTTSADKGDIDVGRAIAQLATVSSQCGSEGPFDFNVDPDAEKLSMEGSTDGFITVHFNRGQKGGDRIFSLFQFIAGGAKKSYNVPENGKENFIWLQLGKGTHFH